MVSKSNISVQHEQVMNISLPCNLLYASIVQGFALNTSNALGADNSDSQAICLIAEECFAYTITGMGEKFSEVTFELTLRPSAEGITIECKYKGIPLNLRDSFSRISLKLSEDAEMEDISLHILKTMADEIQFLNMEKDGWVIRIFKKCKLQIPDEKILEGINVPSDEIEIRSALPSDAKQITLLTYDTYGISYSRRIFYRIDQLEQLISSKQALIALAVWKEHIVSMAGIMKKSDSLYELGLAMVSPVYTHSTAIFKIYSYLMSQFYKDCGNALLFADCVTSHVRSQGLLRTWTACSISFSAYDAPDFVGIKSISSQRESLLYLVAPLKETAHWKIYAPTEHIELLSNIITQIGGTADINPFTADASENEHTIFISRKENEKDEGACSYILDKFGNDFNDQLRQLTLNAVIHHALAISIAIKLIQNLSESIIADLHSAGYFFTGFLPTPDHSWEMIYEYLSPQPFDFSNINILHPKNKGLLNYIQKDKL